MEEISDIRVLFKLSAVATFLLILASFFPSDTSPTTNQIYLLCYAVVALACIIVGEVFAGKLSLQKININ
ncbi:MAG: hypothetical protein RIQ54_336 [Candidatus Parcubacteria bacterium]|jgi:peptidoglycan/LPS O-acetylase OafA/YrhL